ncbi:MAG: copper chaperone PCu(A)C [Acidiferrobacterales bacterium]
MTFKNDYWIAGSGKVFAIGALLFSLALPQSVLAASIIATGGKIKLPEKDSIEAPGYVTLENTTDQEIIVIKVRSKAFKMSMINQAVQDGDQTREILRPDLVLKPMSKLVMKKDGVHILFAGPNQKLKVGNSITADFYLNDSEKVPVEFKIVK